MTEEERISIEHEIKLCNNRIKKNIIKQEFLENLMKNTLKDMGKIQQLFLVDLKILEELREEL